MAKLERTVTGVDIDTLAQRIIEGITSSSVSASFEAQSKFTHDDVSCINLVFERYSAMGANRVSVSVTLFGSAGDVQVSAITSGGSQALFWKINRFGEEAFLKKVDDVLAQLGL